MLLILLKLAVTIEVGACLYLLALIFFEANRRKKLVRHNDLGDHLGDHIDESEWEHGE